MPPPSQDKNIVIPDFTAMFITVKYGDNLQQIFNPDCRNNALVHAIKKRCNCHFDELVELSDEQGSVKNIHSNPGDYGTDYFQDRETLILLRVERDMDDDDRPHYVPLLEGMNEEFIAKLNPKPRGSRRSSHETPRGRHRRTSVTGTAKAANHAKNMARKTSKVNPPGPGVGHGKR